MLVIHDGATYPGTVLRCRPIGVLKVLQVSERKKRRNDRVVAVPQHSFFAGDLPDVRNLPATATEQLEKFFDATNALKSKKLEFLGWRGAAAPSS
ncbi:inorganic diphosphatase [Bradyrhizobium sp. DASA03120]|uniref:inorganic diphosphatase n=1 Tax=Bradyrhizobium sp. SMVTL-02 TaxID=3395917 RepID=UPI003F709D90